MTCVTRNKKGFTFVEFIISLGILTILAVITVPSYLTYTRKIYYHELIAATSPFKIAVLECYEKLGTIMGCDAGSHDIPTDVLNKTGAVAAVKVRNGVIVAVPVPAHGVNGLDTYVLTPIITHDVLTWIATGGGVNNGYAG